MASDKVMLVAMLLNFFIPYSIRRLCQRIRALRHRLSYRAVPSAQNVVVVGASFSGLQLAKRLSESLPTGYKVIMVEKNSHLNFSWNFPRFSVIPGYEQLAFIPYDAVDKGAPPGIFSHVRDSVTQITTTQAYLGSGKKLDYAYLAIATGSAESAPGGVVSSDSQEACAELRVVQQNIQKAGRIAVVGGGAVGIEVASDIKSFYPNKDVTLFHSRSQLLPTFGRRLHEHVVTAFEQLGIHIVFQKRPDILPGNKQLRTSKDLLEFDMIIPCTGQCPNSAILRDLAADSISNETKRILVNPTLQIRSSSSLVPHIFALGDVAETGGPRMARAGQSQAEVVVENILAMIEKRSPSVTYKPQMLFEGTIKLTLGKSGYVIYAVDSDGSDLMVPGVGGEVDLGIGRAWKEMGVEYKKIDKTQLEG